MFTQLIRLRCNPDDGIVNKLKIFHTKYENKWRCKMLEIQNIYIEVVNELFNILLSGCGKLSGLDFRKTENFITLGVIKMLRVLVRDWQKPK